ncbi:MAG: hypothetical protein QMC38_08365, partial [Sinobacterium sp.]
MTQQQIDEACTRIMFAAQALGQSCLTIDTNSIADKTELEGLLQFKVGGSCSWLYVDKKTNIVSIIHTIIEDYIEFTQIDNDVILSLKKVSTCTTKELTDRLHTLLTCQGLSLVAVIDTHGHGDHQSCRGGLADDYLALQQTDFLGWPSNSMTTIIHGKHYPYITLGNKWLVKVNTPGHTGDSISLVLCDPIKASTNELVVHYAFCGDLILMDSLGRTNFVTSSAAAMFTSLQLLKTLIGAECLICPSHDYNNEFTTSITAEISRNSLLVQVMANEINVEEFSIQKALMDTHIVDESGREIMCGALIVDCQKGA